MKTRCNLQFIQRDIELEEIKSHPAELSEIVAAEVTKQIRNNYKDD